MSNKQALIGCTGFVGGVLQQTSSADYLGAFNVLVNRANLESLRGQHFAKIYCAGLPAVKWLANKEPEADLANVQLLQDVLSTVTADHFVLISSIDVYPDLQNHAEDYDCTQKDNHAYGRHRLIFEQFVAKQFASHNIVRLPALFGSGLKKNVIYDLAHNNCLEMIVPNALFQWYPLARLPADLKVIEQANLPVVNLFTQPIYNAQIIARFFPDKVVGPEKQPAPIYNLKTNYAALFGGQGGYMMSAEQVLNDMAVFLKDFGCDAD